MGKGKILVTPRSLSRDGHPYFSNLTDLGYEVVYCEPGIMPDEPTLLELVPGCVGWLAGVEPVSARVLDAADSLKVISRNGTGIDNLPLNTLAQKGIALKKAEGANARGVAELAIAMMLAGLRHIPETATGVKRGEWPRVIGREIQGKTVGVIGMGAIGSQVAQMVMGLGARVRAYDPLLNGRMILGEQLTFVSQSELLSTSDIITFHCPSPQDGKPVLDSARIDTLKDGVVVINTARAALVDHNVVYNGLLNNKIALYGADVFPTEPPKPHPLWQHSRCIATSHIGGFTRESVDKATISAVDQLLDVLEGHGDG
ncbi:phosphoglycerate dehydrogenase [Parasalinivibrio latis]|uniref:phosphoglycerate dehydrogenase n=1 Tax=Parasalinivibrio latis TaxID=2952610 RepID=UPI0030E51F7C